jgi:MFS family permease
MDDVISPASAAGQRLGQTLDSIPFSPYHVMIIGVLGLVGFVDGYDLLMTGSLLLLAKAPLHLTEPEIRYLAVASNLMTCTGLFIASTISDHFSRKTIMLIGVAVLTFSTLLIPLAQTAEQLILFRLLTGVGGGLAVTAPFPIAAELMPAQHRRTFGAVYEISLAAAFAVLPLVGGLLAGNAASFRWMALPGGLSFFVIPPLIYFLIPESPRWHLRRGEVRQAVDIVNQIIRRSGGRVAQLSGEYLLGGGALIERIELPPYRALFSTSQLRWTAVGIGSYLFANCAFFLMSVLLPKALVDQGAAVSVGFTITSLMFGAAMFGRAFTGFLMEIIGRRRAIAYALVGSLPGLALMMTAHEAPGYAKTLMVAGALIAGFTVLSAGAATRVYLSEQFPTELRGRGHSFSEGLGRLLSGVIAPFLMAPFTGSPTVFFGTMVLLVAIGAFIPLCFGRETIGQLELVTKAAS